MGGSTAYAFIIYLAVLSSSFDFYLLFVSSWTISCFHCETMLLHSCMWLCEHAEIIMPWTHSGWYVSYGGYIGYIWFSEFMTHYWNYNDIYWCSEFMTHYWNYYVYGMVWHSKLTSTSIIVVSQWLKYLHCDLLQMCSIWTNISSRCGYLCPNTHHLHAHI